VAGQEFVKAVWKLERRGVATSVEVNRAIEQFWRLDAKYVDSRDWPIHSLAIARRYRQARMFDAIYLACAEDLGAELWTCDRRFVLSFGGERPGMLKLCPDDLA